MIQEALDSQVKEALENINKQIPPKNEIEAAAARFAQQVVEYLNAQIAAVISQSTPGTTLTLSPEMRERARMVIINTIPETAQIGDPRLFIPIIEIHPREAVRKALDPATFNRLPELCRYHVPWYQSSGEASKTGAIVEGCRYKRYVPPLISQRRMTRESAHNLTVIKSP